MSFIHWNKSMSSASHQRHLACCRLQALTCPRASCSEVWCSQQYTRRSPVPQQTTAPFRLHSWTSFLCQQDREDGTYPTLVMLWGWTETWCRIWNNLQVKHEGRMDVSVCPTWASPMNFLQPLLWLFTWGKGWLDGVGHQGPQLLQAICFINHLFYICLSQTAMEGQREVEAHLCPDKRVDQVRGMCSWGRGIYSTSAHKTEPWAHIAVGWEWQSSLSPLR